MSQLKSDLPSLPEDSVPHHFPAELRSYTKRFLSIFIFNSKNSISQSIQTHSQKSKFKILNTSRKSHEIALPKSISSTKIDKDKNKNTIFSNESQFKRPRKHIITMTPESFSRKLIQIMIINQFVRNIKLISGRFGSLGSKQLRILNDLSSNYENIKEIETINILSRLILKEISIEERKKILIQNKWLINFKETFLSYLLKNLEKIPIFSPKNIFFFILNLLLLLFNVCELFYIPYVLTFTIEIGIEIQNIRLFFYLLMFFEWIILFNISFYDKGLLINDRIEIIKNTLNESIFSHFFSIFPMLIIILLDTFVIKISFIDNLNWLCLFRIGYLNNIISKITQFYFHDSKKSTFIMFLLKLLFILFFVIHLISCIFYDISLESYNGFLYDYKETQTIEKYLICLYLSTTTILTIGYGDIHAIKEFEKILFIPIILLSCVVFGYIMNTVGDIIVSINRSDNLLSYNIHLVSLYLENKTKDDRLKFRIRQYLEFVLTENHIMALEGFEEIRVLSHTLRMELYQQRNSSFIDKITIFNSFSKKFLYYICVFMKEMMYTPEDVIIDEDEEIDSNSIFFIIDGKVDIFIQNKNGLREDSLLAVLEKDQHFGEISFFSGCQRTASATSQGFTTLLSLTRNDFLNYLKNSPLDYENFCMIKDQILLYNKLNVLNIKCYCCRYYNHLAKDCPMVHVTINKQTVIREFSRTHKDPGRIKFDRNRLKSKKTLTNLETLIKCAINLMVKNTMTDTISTYNDDEDEVSENEKTSIKFLRKDRKNNSSPIFVPKRDSNIPDEIISDLNSTLISKLFENKEKEELINQFETFKSYDLYFPHNNIENVILEMKNSVKNQNIFNSDEEILEKLEQKRKSQKSFQTFHEESEKTIKESNSIKKQEPTTPGLQIFSKKLRQASRTKISVKKQKDRISKETKKIKKKCIMFCSICKNTKINN